MHARLLSESSPSLSWQISALSIEINWCQTTPRIAEATEVEEARSIPWPFLSSPSEPIKNEYRVTPFPSRGRGRGRH